MVLGVYCAGGLGGEVMELAKEINEIEHQWDYICFINDVAAAIETNDEILAFEAFHQKYGIDKGEIVIASGEPQGRKQLYKKLEQYGYQMPNLIHPSAVIRNMEAMGDGNIIQNFVCFSPSHVKIGNNNVFMPFTRIAHDSQIKNHCVFSSSSDCSGHIVIEDCCFIGTGAKLRDCITVESNVIVGMGAIVLKSVEKQSVVVGNPAKKIRENTGYVFDIR